MDNPNWYAYQLEVLTITAWTNERAGTRLESKRGSQKLVSMASRDTGN